MDGLADCYTTPMTTACIYLRKSQVRTEKEGESLKRQRADCLAYCLAKGFDVVDVREEAQSAYAEKERPIWEKTLKELREGKFQHLIVWKLDRASRKGVIGIAQMIQAVQAVGGVLHSVNEHLDLDTPMGRGVAGIIASVAEQESSNISLRVKSATRQQAAEGRMHGGARKFGWTTTGELVPEEAALIKEAAKRVIVGESLRRIATDWNEREIKTARNASGWHGMTIRQMLLSPVNRGVRTHKGQEVQGDFPTIITTAQHAKISSKLRSTKTGMKQQSLLAGLSILLCGECGRPMRAAGPPKKGQSSRYACQSEPGNGGCGKVHIVRYRVDEEIERRLLLGMKKAPGQSSDPREALETLLEEDRKALDEATADRYIRRTITDKQFGQVYDTLTKRIEATEEKLSRLAPDALRQPGKDFASHWEGADFAERRDIIKNAIIWVKIFPAVRYGNVFDFSRIKIRWALGWILDHSQTDELVDATALK